MNYAQRTNFDTLDRDFEPLEEIVSNSKHHYFVINSVHSIFRDLRNLNF